MDANAFKSVVLLSAVVLALAWWFRRSGRSPWFPLPTTPPVFTPADFTRRNDPGRTIDFIFGTGTPAPGNLPASYILKNGWINYLDQSGRPVDISVPSAQGV